MIQAALPLVAMTEADDFTLYEAFVARRMKPGDYYSAAEMKSFIAAGSKSAWWVREKQGKVVGWCALTHRDEDWPGEACSFLGIAVDEGHAGTALALRLIRRVLKEGGDRPMMTYIQPGVETERLIKPLGFVKVGVKAPWNVYVRGSPAC